jgi:hypothetical protein
LRCSRRLEKVFEFIGAPTKGKKSDAIDGIIKKAEGMMKKAKDHTVRDAAMLAASQAVEHYEIARYGSLKGWAQRLGIPEAAKLLDETLREEKDTDEKLSALAMSEIKLNVDNEKSEHTKKIEFRNPPANEPSKHSGFERGGRTKRHAIQTGEHPDRGECDRGALPAAFEGDYATGGGVKQRT